MESKGQVWVCTEPGTDNPKESSSLIEAIDLSLEFTDMGYQTRICLFPAVCLWDVSVSPPKISKGVLAFFTRHVKGKADCFPCFVFHLGSVGMVALIELCRTMGSKKRKVA